MTCDELAEATRSAPGADGRETESFRTLNSPAAWRDYSGPLFYFQAPGTGAGLFHDISERPEFPPKRQKICGRHRAEFGV